MHISFILIPHCLRLDTQWMLFAFDLAFERAGSNMPAKMAIMAITTKSSMSVKPWFFIFGF